MAPDSETTSDKVEKNLSDLTLPDICSLNRDDLSFHTKDSSDVDKGEKVNGVHQSSNGKVCDDDDGIPVPEVQLDPPGQVCLEWTKVHKVGAGLANLGNTCFLNTVIQCLTYCPPLANYLLQGDHSANCKSFEFCMMCELQKHMRQAFQRSGDVIKPLCIYQNLKYIADHFQFGQQEDAHEFLRFVIDNLWRSSIYSHPNDDTLDPASRETTIINHIFGGYNRSQVVCLQCNLKSDKFEHFMDFILDIQNAHSLEKAVEQFVKPELLENENAYKCPKCDALVPAEKTFTIHRPPNVATFQLKRFHYHKSYGKITKHVSYPENFDLRPYMSQRKGGSLLYKLNAVLVHMGQNCNSGHYYCYIRNSNGFWYLMDDAKVQKVSLHDVLNQQAYVLFYVRSSHSSIHFKRNGVSSVVDFQNAKIRSPGDIMPQLSTPKKNLSFQKTSQRKSLESGTCSVVCLTQPFSNMNSDTLNREYDRDMSLVPEYSRALQYNNRKLHSNYDRRLVHKKFVGRVWHQNISLHQNNNSSDETALVPQLFNSYSHPSSEKDCRHNGYENNSSVVCDYDVSYNINYKSYMNGVDDQRYINSAAKYQSFDKSASRRNRFFQDNSFSVSSKIKISGNQYSHEKNSFYTPANFTENHQRCFYSISAKSVDTQYNHKSIQNKFYRRGENNFCKNNYINSGVQGYHPEYEHGARMNGYSPLQCDEGFQKYQGSEQFSIPHYRNEAIARNGHHKTFSGNDEWNQSSESFQSSSVPFTKRSERNSDFRKTYYKNGYDNDWCGRKNYFASPKNNILKEYGCRTYQGKVKRRRQYFSCGMDHFASPSFPKFKGLHRPAPYHDKCFYLNIC